MKIISVKVSEDLKNRIKNYAENTGTSPSSIIREAIEKYLSSKTKRVKGSFLDRAEDILGIGEGPEDLSTNKKYMKNFGRS
jgi:hypothetical protein